MKRHGKWMALLLAGLTVLSLLLAGCGEQPAETDRMDTDEAYQPAYQPQDTDPLLLWEVTSPEDSGKKLYLTGTIHIGPAEITALPEPLETAFQSADTLAVEVDLLAFQEDFAAQASLSTKYGYYADGEETAQDHLSKETYEKARHVLAENGLDPDGMASLKVSQWSAALSEISREKAGFSGNYGVDLYLMERAREAGKPIVEIESVESQLELNDSFSDALQEMVLVNGLDVDAVAKGQQQLYECWLAGDAETLAAQETSEGGQPTAEEQKLLDEYYEKMLYSRSRNMAKKAEGYLKSGKTVLLAVGAGHMGGEKGIVRLLQNDGCMVRQIARNGETYSGGAAEEVSSAAA